MSRIRKWMVRFAWLLLAALLGAACTLGSQAVMAWWAKKHEVAGRPAQALQEADTELSQFNQRAIHSAIQKYNSVLAKSDLSKEFQAHAYRGLSRAYSELMALEFRLGLPRDIDREAAPKYAKSAASLDPKESIANEITRVYALDSVSIYGYENETRKAIALANNEIKRAIIELLGRPDLGTSDQLEVRYLAWRTKATDSAKAFPDELRTNEISSVRILTDVGLHYLDHSSKNIQRSTEMCARATIVDPTNQVAQYCLGYADNEAGRFPEAEEHFKRALEGTNDDPYFPRARNNLGVTYFAERHYPEARRQIESAVGTPGAPARLLTFWLYNLGEIELELEQPDDACSKWQEAAKLPRSGAAFAAAWGMAQCEYLKPETQQSAHKRYATAVKLGCAEGYDLTNIKTFEDWHAGPKELEIATALIQSPEALKGCGKGQKDSKK